MKISLELPQLDTLELNDWAETTLFLEFMLQASKYIDKEDEEIVLQYIDEAHYSLEKDLIKNKSFLAECESYLPSLYERLNKKVWRKSTAINSLPFEFQELSE